MISGNVKDAEVVEMTEADYQERAILVLLAKYATNKEIASVLYVSENTVKVHVRNIMRKLGAHNRLEAGICAMHSGLLN